MTPNENPYASPSGNSTPVDEAVSPPATAAGATMLACGVIGEFVALINLLVYTLMIFDANPIPGLNNLKDQAPLQLVVNFIMAVQGIAMIAGGLSMIQRRRKWFALLGAWASILPICGCFVLPAGVGIWALFAMRSGRNS